MSVDDREALGKELQKLSVGAASVFHKFMHIASDFAKTTPEEAEPSNQSAAVPTKNRLSRFESSIESFDEDEQRPAAPVSDTRSYPNHPVAATTADTEPSYRPTYPYPGASSAPVYPPPPSYPYPPSSKSKKRQPQISCTQS